MCHGQEIKAFPSQSSAQSFDNHVSGFVRGGQKSKKRIAILPDIFGCNPFYHGLATHYEHKQARVYLVDIFSGFGELSEATREAAFTRRHKVADKDFLDRFEKFAKAEKITGVIGFCLGGFYIFELARRGFDGALVGLYGFPQGLPNQDPLPVPFDYLLNVTKFHTMLMGGEDESVGIENIMSLKNIAAKNKAINLRIYESVGHNFLPLLDSEDQTARNTAENALHICDTELL